MAGDSPGRFRNIGCGGSSSGQQTPVQAETPAQADPWTGRLLISCLKQEPSILASRLVWNRSTVARDQLLSAENTAAANYLFPDFRVSSHVCRGMCKCNQWWLVEL